MDETPYVFQRISNNEIRRGGALLDTSANQVITNSVMSDPGVQAGVQAEAWYVLWTRSNFEQQVHDQLCAKGFEIFLPKIDKWSKRGGRRQLVSVPLFPGYLFVRHAMDKMSYIEISKARGLVRILGERWDRLATVPNDEVEAIRRIQGCKMPSMPHPYLKEGQLVRIIRGPLANVEGILAESDAEKGLLVLSVDLLRQSVAVEIDCTWVVPA